MTAPTAPDPVLAAEDELRGAAPDVHDGLAFMPVQLRESVGELRSPALHGPVEVRSLLWAFRKPGPEIG